MTSFRINLTRYLQRSQQSSLWCLGYHLIQKKSRCSPESDISSDLVTFREVQFRHPLDNLCYYWTLPWSLYLPFGLLFFQAWKQDKTCLPAMVRSMKAWYKLVSASIYWINGGAYPLAYWSRRSRMRLNCTLSAKELSPNCQLNQILSSFRDYSNSSSPIKQSFRAKPIG